MSNDPPKKAGPPGQSNSPPDGKKPRDVGIGDAYRSEDEPSIVRRANEAFLKHRHQQDVTGHDSNSYRPKHHPAANKTPQAPGPAPMGSDHFDNLIGEILRQQEQVRQPPKSILAIKTDRSTLIRIAILAAVLIGLFKLSDQQDQSLAKLDSLQRNQEMLANQDDDSSQQTERDNLFEDIGKSSKSDLARNLGRTNNGDQPPGALAAKVAPVTALTEQEKNEQKLRAWRDLLTCAGQSLWSGYHSPNFVKLTDDFFIYARGDWVYAFTPFFTGVQQAFDGWFWQESIGRLTAYAGLKTERFYPAKDFVFSYDHYFGKAGKYVWPGAFYARFKRGGAIVGSPVYRMGKPITKIGNRTLSQMREHNVMWVRDVTYLRSKYAKLLVGEVEAQIKRFVANEERPWPLIAFSKSSSTAWNVHQYQVMKACQRAGQMFNQDPLTEAASKQLERIRLQPRETWFPTVAIRGVAVGAQPTPAPAPYWYPGRYTTHELRSCLLSANVPAGVAFDAKMTVNERGMAQNLTILASSSIIKSVQQCYQPLLRKMTFPPDRKARQRVLVLKYLYQ